MDNETGDSPEKSKIIQLLNIEDQEYSTIVEKYHQEHSTLYEKLRSTTDIKERIKQQNVLLELEDAFLEYQTSLHRRGKNGS